MFASFYEKRVYLDFELANLRQQSISGTLGRRQEKRASWGILFHISRFHDLKRYRWDLRSNKFS